MPMNSKLKRIIAREGLIIIACAVCAGFFLFIQGLIPYGAIYNYDVETGGHKYRITSENPFFGLPDLSDQDKAGLYKAFQNDYPNIFKKKNEVDFMPDDFKISSPMTQYTLTGNIRNLLRNLGLFAVFIVYPLYLIIRFVFWASRTLRQKE